MAQLDFTGNGNILIEKIASIYDCHLQSQINKIASENKGGENSNCDNISNIEVIHEDHSTYSFGNMKKLQLEKNMNLINNSLSTYDQSHYNAIHLGDSEIEFEGTYLLEQY